MQLTNFTTDSWIALNAGEAIRPHSRFRIAGAKSVHKWRQTKSASASASSSTPTIAELGVPVNDFKMKHIHPCVCNLQPNQRKRIVSHKKKVKKLRAKFRQRVNEIEETLGTMEAEQRQTEQENHNPGNTDTDRDSESDKFEEVKEKKSPKKRITRKVTMQSLGVIQVVNPRKTGTVKFSVNKTYLLRRENSAYCGRKVQPTPPPKVAPVYHKLPKNPIRMTRTYVLRSERNVEKVKDLIAKEDKRPLFVTTHYYPIC